MYRGLTAKNSRLCRVQPPGAAPEPSISKIPASFRSLHRPAQRAADKEGGFEPERRRSQVTILFQGRLQTRHNRLYGPQGPICDGRRALRRHAGLSATDKAALFAANVFQTGRRLMRQTVLPTRIYRTIAPTRSDSSARRVASRRS